MVKNKDECKEKTMKDKKNKGYKEPKDPLTEKAPRHQAASMKKEEELISDDVAISPAGNDTKEKEDTTQEAAVVDLKDKDVKIPEKEQNEDTVTLRFEDTDKFLDTLKKFETENNLELAMDFDTESYIVGVPIDKVEAFRNFMSDNGIIEITDTQEIDERIAEVQKGRSELALAMDKSMTASRVVSKENANEWLKHPNQLDLDGVDTKAEE